MVRRPEDRIEPFHHQIDKFDGVSKRCSCIDDCRRNGAGQRRAGRMGHDDEDVHCYYSRLPDCAKGRTDMLDQHLRVLHRREVSAPVRLAEEAQVREARFSPAPREPNLLAGKHADPGR